jgi:hypothetical protein
VETCAAAGIANTAAATAVPAIVRIEIFKCRLQGRWQRGLSGFGQRVARLRGIGSEIVRTGAKSWVLRRQFA